MPSPTPSARAKPGRGPDAGKVAVVAHIGKTFGGGLSELAGTLAAAGVTDPLWFEVDKSRKAPKRIKKALDQGAELVFVWGGDGMVQRSIDALAKAKSQVPLAILPAGTANLLAGNLGIPADILECVTIGLKGPRKAIDLGKVNGERFAVMAGVGFDAAMVAAADGALKKRLGRFAYLWTGAKQLDAARFDARITVDGEPWFEGLAACVLFGNVGSAFGGITLFEQARLDDGRLDFGVVTAEGAVEWMGVLARTLAKQPEGSPFVRFGTGRRITVDLGKPVPYEVDGGERPATGRLRVKVQPGAVTVCLPRGPAPEALA